MTYFCWGEGLGRIIKKMGAPGVKKNHCKTSEKFEGFLKAPKKCVFRRLFFCTELTETDDKNITKIMENAGEENFSEGVPEPPRPKGGRGLVGPLPRFKTNADLIIRGSIGTQLLTVTPLPGPTWGTARAKTGDK